MSKKKQTASVFEDIKTGLNQAIEMEKAHMLQEPIPTTCVFNMPPSENRPIPDDVIEHVAEGLLPNVIEFFRDPKSREEIEKWQQEQKTEKKP